ncbi:hypothetical protein HK405_009713 [Cladochytrium tenue]|nr:hypothetical protein HK405_009713 [Cladochytrium tenue]
MDPADPVEHVPPPGTLLHALASPPAPASSPSSSSSPPLPSSSAVAAAAAEAAEFPAAKRRALQDLVLFEERLRQNMLRLNRSRRRWEVVLAALSAAFAYFAYSTLWAARDDPNLINSVLRPFNMEFNKSSRGEITFSRAVPAHFQESYEGFRERLLRGWSALPTPSARPPAAAERRPRPRID